MNTYLLFKSLHLIAVISWMAGLLYLPRIFVYHAENSLELKTSEIFKIMEKKLYFYKLNVRAFWVGWKVGWIFHQMQCPRLRSLFPCYLWFLFCYCSSVPTSCSEQTAFAWTNWAYRYTTTIRKLKPKVTRNELQNLGQWSNVDDAPIFLNSYKEI